MEKEKIKEALIGYFEAEPEEKFTVQELADKLKMNKAGQFNFVVQAVAQLEHDKVITLDDEGNFSLVRHESAPKFPGIFHANDRGFGFVTVDPEEPDYFINPTQTLSALNGDEVEVEMIAVGDPTIGKRPEGKITKIIQRNLTQVVGEFKPLEGENLPNGIIGSVHLRDKKLSNYRFLVEDTGLHPVAGEIVLADITTYPSSELPGIIKGIATKVIGNVNDPGIDILQIVYQHDIPHQFPEDVMQQVAKIPDHVTPEQKIGRRDLTSEPMVTIDSIESKDLDDAVSVRKLANGNYHLGVHIADVSHYVTPNTPLDREAFERGTSVYLTDRVIPMIPAKLSNGICSLNPQVERLALTCEMQIDPQGEVVSHEIFPSVIKTTERMTYKAINKILESDDQKEKERYHDLVPMFEEMAELHKILLKMRKRRGAIEFEDTEAKIIVDEKGHAIDIQLRERGTSERMVESFMLAANETVAAHYKNLHVPFIYRIHETPKEEKIKSFFEMLSGLGVEVTGKVTDIKPKMLQKILKKVAGKPEEPMVSVMLLRSMQQAKYSPEPLGHFGLAAKDYTHFTSPIRRYPDLMAHRMIHYYAENGLGEASQAKFQAELPEVSQYSSQAERRAIDAERDTDAMKKAEYMADHVGEEFDAVVSSVTKFGMFVELPNTVEGLIHISEINDDYYVFVEKQMALVGRKTKQTYRIGQPIRVKLVNVNAEQKEIDFKLLSLGEAPKTDLLEGVELPEMPPRKKFDRKNGDKRGKRPFKRQNNNNRRDYKRDKPRLGDRNDGGRKPFYKKRREQKK
ncbi:ribonuclease R [Ligilactobacillus murinus]|uniref:ribonuclease R n=1 Tax=Ligilactobacillus murinus TaxID=1622 RepID=UPI001C8CD445|nr:ribonuclease R [Ligilactobacillus murinus]MBX9013037.1 ribonuclease R [Ligilactobacillus murinus]